MAGRKCARQSAQNSPGRQGTLQITAAAALGAGECQQRFPRDTAGAQCRALTLEAVWLVGVGLGKHVLQAVAEGGGGGHDVPLRSAGRAAEAGAALLAASQPASPCRGGAAGGVASCSAWGAHMWQVPDAGTNSPRLGEADGERRWQQGSLGAPLAAAAGGLLRKYLRAGKPALLPPGGRTLGTTYWRPSEVETAKGSLQ
jgi:hypothetical protein